MEQYIPKDAVVAEIEKIIADETESIKSFEHGKNVSERQRSNARIGVLTHLRSLLDTLEVKEVDLEKYYHEFLQKEWFGNPHVRTVSEMMAFTAKHFYELGIKAQRGEKV